MYSCDSMIFGNFLFNWNRNGFLISLSQYPKKIIPKKSIKFKLSITNCPNVSKHKVQSRKKYHHQNNIEPSVFIILFLLSIEI
jgi:hypothetical protein